MFRYLLILFGLVFTLGAAAARENEGGGAVEYVEFKPRLTVNLAGTRRYLMVNAQALAESAEAVAALQKHMPALRHELIMLFSNRSADQLQTAQQREALRTQAAEALKKTLKAVNGDRGFRDVYFTEFLID